MVADRAGDLHDSARGERTSGTDAALGFGILCSYGRNYGDLTCTKWCAARGKAPAEKLKPEGGTRGFVDGSVGASPQDCCSGFVVPLERSRLAFESTGRKSLIASRRASP